MVTLQFSLLTFLAWCVAEAFSVVHWKGGSRRRGRHRGGCPLGLPKRVALVYHGEYYRRREAAVHHRGAMEAGLGGAGDAYFDDSDFDEGELERPIICSNYFETAANIQKNIVQPLEECGTEFFTFFHTFTDSSRPCRDEKLVRSLAPQKHRFDSHLLPRIVDSYIEALRLTQPELSALRIDAVLLLRFDVKYRQRITEAAVDWGAVNLAHHGLKDRWKATRRVSDLLFIFPANYTENVVQALDSCARVGHDVFDPLARQVGSEAVHFIDGGYHASLTFENTKAWLGINRACGDNTTACE